MKHAIIRLATLGAVAAIALSGCNLIGDVLGTSPAPGTLELQITGPKDADTKVSVAGEGISQQYSDDGRGFSTSISVRPGSYTITANPSAGQTALVSVTQKTGNSTRPGSQTVRVDSGEATSVSVTYKAP